MLVPVPREVTDFDEKCRLADEPKKTYALLIFFKIHQTITIDDAVKRLSPNAS